MLIVRAVELVSIDRTAYPRLERSWARRHARRLLCRWFHAPLCHMRSEAKTANEVRALPTDAQHNRDCHRRWIQRRNRLTGEPSYLERWYFEQCGDCRSWVALAGELGHDFGVCTSRESTFDGQVRFEHDGCEAFIEREGGAFG